MVQDIKFSSSSLRQFALYHCALFKTFFGAHSHSGKQIGFCCISGPIRPIRKRVLFPRKTGNALVTSDMPSFMSPVAFIKSPVCSFALSAIKKPRRPDRYLISVFSLCSVVACVVFIGNSHRYLMSHSKDSQVNHPNAF